MWSRYRVELAAARRGEPVLGPGPPPVEALGAGDVPASSSLRACTLRLPSVVLQQRLELVEVSDSTAASALTMPSRMRWWMRLSRGPPARPGRARRGRGGALPRGAVVPDRPRRAAAFESATVPPRHEHPEGRVQSAEARDHELSGPRRREKQRRRAEDHEPGPDEGDDPDGQGAGRHEAGAVEEQPEPGSRASSPARPSAAVRMAPETTRGREAQPELPQPAPHERLTGAARLPRVDSAATRRARPPRPQPQPSRGCGPARGRPPARSVATAPMSPIATGPAPRTRRTPRQSPWSPG